MADTGTLPRTGPGAEPVGRHRADRRATTDVAARALLVVAASTAALLDAPTWLRTLLTLAAALVVAESAVRYRRRGLLDAALVGAAGLVVAAVLLGLVLNLTPAGLTRQSWAIGAGILGLVALAAGLRGPAAAGVLSEGRSDRFRPALGDTRSEAGHRTSIVVGVVCGVLAVAVVAVTFVVAADSTRENQIAPLQMSAAVTDGRITGVTLSDGTTGGPYDLIVLADGAATTAAAGVSLDGTPRTVPVTVPTTGRVLIDLVPVGSATPVRQLIVDGGQLTPATSVDPTGDVTTGTGTTGTSDSTDLTDALQMAPKATDGPITAVALSSTITQGPFDLVVLADGASTTAAAAFYLGATPRTVPVTVPATGRALIDLVPVGSATPVRQLIVDDGRVTG